MTKKQLGRRIQQEREYAGLSQEDLANAVGVSQELVARWEKGERQLKADQLPLIAAALGITVGRIYGEGVPRTKDFDAVIRNHRHVAAGE
jgi:transcriptional regulator with XRE-family HTH domain